MTFFNIWIRGALVSLFLLGAAGCGEGVTPPAGGGTGSGTDGGGGGGAVDCTGVAAATLDDVFSSYFAAGQPTTCVTGCHGAGAGQFSFSTAQEFYAAAVNQKAKASADLLVKPGDPAHSYVYEKLLPSASARMPQGGPYLDAAALAKVAGWICAGAPAPGSSGTPDGGNNGTPDGGSGPTGPAVTALSPVSGYVGTVVEVQGTGFSSSLTGNIVQFNGVAGSVVSASATAITANVPAGASTGPVSVTVNSKTAQSPMPFTVLQGNPVPLIDSLSPCGAVAGAGALTVTVTGQNFQADSTATFNGASVALTYVSDTEVQLAITAPMLASAPSGNVANVVVSNPAPGGGASPAAIFGVASSVSTLASDVQPIFTSTCATSGCHNGLSNSLDLRTGKSWQALVDQPSDGCPDKMRVVRCAPTRAKSMLIDKILATFNNPPCSGSPMPKGGPLSAAEKQRIIDWVAQGAPQ